MRIVIERNKHGELKVMTDEPGLHEAIEVDQQGTADCWVFPDHEYVERMFRQHEEQPKEDV